MDNEYTYKYEITVHRKQDVEELFKIVERFQEGSHGSIKPLDNKSLEITTEILDFEE